MIDFEAIDELISLGRQEMARTVVLTAAPTSDAEQWGLDLRRVLLTNPIDDDPAFEMDIDTAAISCLALAERAPSPDEAARACLGALGHALSRRVRPVAERIVDQIEGYVGPDHYRLMTARAAVHLVFDEREEARDLLARCLAVDPAPLASLAAAQTHYAVGDFVGAREHALALRGTKYRAAGAVLRAACAASLGDPTVEVECLTEAIDIAPDAARVFSLYAVRAFARAALDDIEGVREDLDASLRTVPAAARSAFEPFIRHRLDALAVNGEDAPRARLEAFPSVVQKWNYCGPAVIELCLRYVGVGMTQDIIAEAVKRGEGTPMYEITKFLREQGIAARRIEATPERVRKAIDLGFPVILESDLVNSAHVSVAIGYDERLSLLTVADPATHAPMREGMETRAQVAADLRFGGVLVMGPENQLTDAMMSEVDAAGLVEAAHIVTLDTAARHDHADDDFFGGPLAIEIAGIAATALALEPDFPQATMMRTSALISASSTGNRSDARQALLSARVAYPANPDFRSIGGRWLAAQDMGASALAEISRATALSPHDARIEAHFSHLLADHDEPKLAFAAASRGLAHAPSVPAPTIAAARVVRDELARRFCAREDLRYPTLRFAFAASIATRKEWLTFDDDHLARLCDALTEFAHAMVPDDPYAAVMRADYLAMAGRLEEADAILGSVIEGEARNSNAVMLRLHVAEARGDSGALDELITRVDTAQWNWPQIWECAVDVRARQGDLQGAEALARKAILVCDTDRSTLEAWFEVLKQLHHSGSHAAREVVEFVGERRTNRDLLRHAVAMLDAHGLKGHAATLLRTIVEQDPQDAPASHQLATIIRHTPPHRQEALRLIEAAIAAAPWATRVWTEAAWIAMDVDPELALTYATRVDASDPASLEPRRVALELLGRQDEAQAVRDDMTKAAGSEFYARLTAAQDLLWDGFHKWVAGTVPDGEPDWQDPEEVSLWLRVMLVAGKGGEALELVAAHPQVSNNPTVARTLATYDLREHAALIAPARRAVAAREANPAAAAVWVARARAIERDFDGAVEGAWDNAAALAVLSEAMTDSDERARAVRRAIEPRRTTAMCSRLSRMRQFSTVTSISPGSWRARSNATSPLSIRGQSGSHGSRRHLGANRMP